MVWLIASVAAALVCVCGVLFWVVWPLKYMQQIIDYSAKYNLDAALVAAVICTESRFKPNSTSSSGACGLMQLMPSTFSWVESQLGEQGKDIYNVETNINYGCYYLSYLIYKYGNLVYALACYNAGEGVVCTWGEAENFTVEKIRYSETKNYVKRVCRLKRLYMARF